MNEGQECKTGYITVNRESRRVNEEDKEGWIWLMYFLHIYKNKTLKPTGDILRRGRG
jgi:hypothetical protein